MSGPYKSASRRVTTVSPWVPGGDGQIRDLFPLPPIVFIFFKLIFAILKQWQLLAILCLWWVLSLTDALSATPALFIALFLGAIPVLIKYGIIWYKHPHLPIIARKNTHI